MKRNLGEKDSSLSLSIAISMSQQISLILHVSVVVSSPILWTMEIGDSLRSKMGVGDHIHHLKIMHM